jgi:hypothetical protein
MRYFGSIIIFNKLVNKILLLEYKKNKFMLPCIENKTNLDIITITLLNDLNLHEKNILFSYDSFYILNNDTHNYYMFCILNDNTENIYFDDSEYFDIRFINITDIITKNILDIKITDKIKEIYYNKDKINIPKTTFIKNCPNYFIIRRHILNYLRNIKYKNTINEIYANIKDLLPDNITEYDCNISILFDLRERMIISDGFVSAKYRHDNLLLNEFLYENKYNILNFDDIYDNKYYLLYYEYVNEYTCKNNNLYSNNLQFILINTLDKKITKKIYSKYSGYFEIDVNKCLLDNMIFYIVDNNIIITLGHNNILYSKYILNHICI